MTETVFLAPYLIFSLILIGTLIIQYRQTRHEVFERQPGQSFKVLGRIRDLVTAGNPEGRKKHYGDMSGFLRQMAADIRGYLGESYNTEPSALKLDKRTVRILQNLAICMKAFVFIVNMDPIRGILARSAFSRGLKRLVKTINNHTILVEQQLYYFQASQKDTAELPDYLDSHIDYGKFSGDLIECKETIYCSLFGNEIVDDRITAKFLKDFKNLTNPSDVATYLEVLEANWLGGDSRLHCIPSSYVLALVTVRNLLKCNMRVASSRRGHLKPLVDDIIERIQTTDRFHEISALGIDIDIENQVLDITNEVLPEIELGYLKTAREDMRTTDTDELFKEFRKEFLHTV